VGGGGREVVGGVRGMGAREGGGSEGEYGWKRELG